jgi:hypothetical protein
VLPEGCPRHPIILLDYPPTEQQYNPGDHSQSELRQLISLLLPEQTTNAPAELQFVSWLVQPTGDGVLSLQQAVAALQECLALASQLSATKLALEPPEALRPLVTTIQSQQQVRGPWRAQWVVRCIG